MNVLISILAPTVLPFEFRYPEPCILPYNFDVDAAPPVRLKSGILNKNIKNAFWQINIMEDEAIRIQKE